MKGFVTKYAVSAGIEEVDVELEGNLWRVLPEASRPWSFQYYSATDIKPTREEAVADAELRRTKKIASLRKQIAKLEKMEF